MEMREHQDERSRWEIEGFELGASDNYASRGMEDFVAGSKRYR